MTPSTSSGAQAGVGQRPFDGGGGDLGRRAARRPAVLGLAHADDGHLARRRRRGGRSCPSRRSWPDHALRGRSPITEVLRSRSSSSGPNPSSPPRTSSLCSPMSGAGVRCQGRSPLEAKRYGRDGMWCSADDRPASSARRTPGRPAGGCDRRPRATRPRRRGHRRRPAPRPRRPPVGRPSSAPAPRPTVPGPPAVRRGHRGRARRRDRTARGPRTTRPIARRWSRRPRPSAPCSAHAWTPWGAATGPRLPSLGWTTP